MSNDSVDKKLTWTAAGFVILIPVIHLLVSHFFINDWGINQWYYLPTWFGFLWLGMVGAVALILIISRKVLQDNTLHASIAGGGMVVILAILILFRFDSFVFAAGNIRVAEIAQRDYLLVRWFEYGSFYAVHLLFEVLSTFIAKATSAGVWAWRSFTYLSAVASLVATIKITGLVTRRGSRRIALFVIMFFGPQVLPLFGFVGYSAVVVAFSTWFAYFGLRTLQQRSTISLALMWLVLAAAIFFHISLIYLVPAAFFVTLRLMVRRRAGKIAGIVAAALAFLAVLVITYQQAAFRLEWLVELLTLKGKNPFPDYSLFSPRHLGDMVQIIAGFAPQAVYLLVIIFLFKRGPNKDGSNIFAGILALSGLTVMFITDPSNGIPSDIPIIISYLFGISLLLALYLQQTWSSEPDEPTPRSSIVSAMVIIGALVGYLPTYVNISAADPYLAKYYDHHKEYYSEACFAFRDAYFYVGDLTKANAWEQSLNRRSDYHINITGITGLISQDDNDEALRTLAWVRSKYPYRAEPQELTATAQLNLRRYASAKLHIDTCFMLEPYARENFHNLYVYYRDQQQYPEAVKTLERALAVYKGDIDFTVDLMIAHYRMTDYTTADSLCKVILTRDPNQPFPYLIRGLIAELGQATSVAITNYKKFVELAPDEPEAGFVLQRLDSLQSSSEN